MLNSLVHCNEEVISTAAKHFWQRSCKIDKENAIAAKGIQGDITRITIGAQIKTYLWEHAALW